ncbi:hypothetical protein U4I37_12885 [Stenotrophomonas maltophilia]|uniref:hypothetical protein n=1 Tax=Stenotrophomonas maltophilia TaxID=40324 RepID=UPI0011B38A4C|nr:hypothetical protein [Stenotrophomonas maltophilia]MDZ5787127.1 hypothetical protein [Stenotrophomonas maltophilia]HDS1554324.1 hypothetical protein [Stenotrophomonas maltophilia]
MDDRTYAWNYFSIHAAQRMAVFQFYITLVTAIFGGGVLIAGSAENRKWSVFLFILVPLLSFVFERLDRRTSQMIKKAEAALMELEGNGGGSACAIFTKDHAFQSSEKGGISYSQSFRIVFYAAAILGLAAALVAVLHGGTSKEKELSKVSPHLNSISACEYTPTPALPRCTSGVSEYGLCLYYYSDLPIIQRDMR